MSKINKSLFILWMLLAALPAFTQEIKPLSTIDDVSALMNSNKGKVVLVNFWATWCTPCVKEFPELIKLFNDYKDKDFVIIFISTDFPDEIESVVKPFLKKNKVEFTTYYNNIQKIDDLINSFDTKWEGAIPATYIYNKEGTKTAGFIGKRKYEDFENEIKKNLN